MCYYNSNASPFLTVKKPIVCYKTMYLQKGILRSVYRGYRYVFGKAEPHVELTNGDVIHNGYHSFSRKAANNLFRWSYECLVECIIPTGAKYLFDKKKGEYVSSNITAIKIYKRSENMTKEEMIRLNTVQL